MKTLIKNIVIVGVALFITTTVSTLHAPTASAQSMGEFSLQVSPSPLVTTIKPGQTTELELKIRNTSIEPEDLKIESRSFTMNNETGTVSLDDTTPPDIGEWIQFSDPTFSVPPGQWFTQKVRIALPENTGFSYSFALVISRQNTPQPTESGRLIKGSVAVFTLVNVDRPGATRKLDIVELQTDKQIYEYLPSTVKVTFKNTGNSIVQPYGNIFIQRGSNDPAPVATLAVNENKGYILPGSIRTLETVWGNGFPTLKTNSDGTIEEVWDWSKIADFRIGKYSAKLVGVYNDGTRDIPIEGTISFWVLPWKIILGAVVIIALLLFSIWSIIRKIIKLVRRKKPASDPSQP